jgi:hypothetical protein
MFETLRLQLGSWYVTSVHHILCNYSQFINSKNNFIHVGITWLVSTKGDNSKYQKNISPKS